MRRLVNYYCQDILTHSLLSQHEKNCKQIDSYQATVLAVLQLDHQQLVPHSMTTLHRQTGGPSPKNHNTLLSNQKLKDPTCEYGKLQSPTRSLHQPCLRKVLVERHSYIMLTNVVSPNTSKIALASCNINLTKKHQKSFENQLNKY